VSEAMSYDAHGARREATWESALLSIRPVDTPRGFTGHEHLDAVGIIHMNGRIYDPELGRMLSPDPNVPDPTITQEFNRYAYVRNNPLSYTDPTGFSLFNDDGSFAETPGGTGSPHSGGGDRGSDHSPKPVGHGDDHIAGDSEYDKLSVVGDEKAHTELVITINLPPDLEPDSNVVSYGPFPESGNQGDGTSYSEMAADILVDLTPAGDVRDIIESGQSGNYGMMALSTGSLVLSFTPVGWGFKALKTAFKFLARHRKIRVLANPKSSVNAAKLNKQLASEQQLGEIGVPIAGAGVKSRLRDVNRLVREYGGDADNWSKRSSKQHTAPDGSSFETHWYENSATGQRVEPKTIIDDYIGGGK
ncbi:MAG: RHS repeat-associated core domain-containing protein, partial [Rhodospirillaceae bacterium]